jgi:hypothetical protein
MIELGDYDYEQMALMVDELGDHEFEYTINDMESVFIDYHLEYDTCVYQRDYFTEPVYSIINFYFCSWCVIGFHGADSIHVDYDSNKLEKEVRKNLNIK